MNLMNLAHSSLEPQAFNSIRTLAARLRYYHAASGDFAFMFTIATHS